MTPIELERDQGSPVAIPVPHLAPPVDGLRMNLHVAIKTQALKDGVRNRTCLQCGMNPARPVARRFQYVPPWVYLGLLANIVVVVILYFIGRKTVDAKLGLCTDCDRADRRARTIRGVSVLGLIVGPLLGVAAAALIDVSSVWVAAPVAGLVAGVSAIIAAHRKTHFDIIQAKHIDKDKGVTMLYAAPSFAQVLRDEAPDALAD